MAFGAVTLSAICPCSRESSRSGARTATDTVRRNIFDLREHGTEACAAFITAPNHASIGGVRAAGQSVGLGMSAAIPAIWVGW